MIANERCSRVAQVAEAREALNPRIRNGPLGTRRKDWRKGDQAVSRLTLAPFPCGVAHSSADLPSTTATRSQAGG